ncbi:B12-binding domain-containing radical SAM protein [Pendulispora rubella]|uniref:B12-binding domain-containing radical SAM protein n=1 Tax=Pendulispora rubella TaxID=2741070 RepID=A0ABZ2LCM9_9BACT
MPDPMQNAPLLPPAPRGEPVPYTVLLINPFYAKDIHASFGKHVLTPSLALTSLAGATPAPWTVRFWDENLLQGAPPSDEVPQVVGITVHLTFAKRAYELAAWYRARGSIVVLGGLHALSCPDEVAEHCDAMAIGNGVPIWPKILSDIEHGKLERRYHAEYRNYASDPAPDRSVLPRWGFLTPASLIATQGCHNRCDFCYLATGDTRIKYQMRTAQQVADEFAATGAPYGVFVDNNLGSNRRYLRELCAALRPLNKIWSAAVTLDVSDDPSLVRDMALAGCTGVFIGFESLTDDNIRLAGKRSPRAEDYAARIQLFHANGIQVNGSFVLGFDQDRPDAFEKLANFIEEQRLECATFHILTPYPNTPLFVRMERQNRILHRDWSLYDTAHCVFRPKHMTPEQLEAGYEWIYQRLFSLRSIWARRPRQASAVLPYLGMALLYKRSNWLWKLLIRHRLTHVVWAPLVHATRLRHLRYRKRLEKEPSVPGPLVWPIRPSV